MAESSESTPSGQVPPPSVLYLLLWTACAAALFSLERMQRTLDVSFRQGTAWQVSLIISSSVHAASLAGCLIQLRLWRTRKLSPLRQPGHWFLLLSLLQLTIYVPYLLQNLDGFEPGILWIPAYFVPCVGAALAALQCHGRWRLIFVVQIVYWILLCIGMVGFSTGFALGIQIAFTTAPWVAIVGVVLLLLVSIVERLNGVPRDWLHYVGVISHALMHLVPVLIQMLADSP